MCVCGKPPHQGSLYTEPLVCINCNGQHSARSRNCPVYKQEAAIHHPIQGYIPPKAAKVTTNSVPDLKDTSTVSVTPTEKRKHTTNKSAEDISAVEESDSDVSIHWKSLQKPKPRRGRKKGKSKKSAPTTPT